MKVPDTERNSKNEICFGKEKKKSEPAVRKNRLFECSNRKVLKDRNSIVYFFGEVSNIRELKKIGLPERT